MRTEESHETGPGGLCDAYWISSHGRNKNGKLREERHRFFATAVDTRTVPPSRRPIGSP
jgi:hypothetical protein